LGFGLTAGGPEEAYLMGSRSPWEEATFAGKNMPDNNLPCAVQFAKMAEAIDLLFGL